jgi:hypothetical protein
VNGVLVTVVPAGGGEDPGKALSIPAHAVGDGVYEVRGFGEGKHDLGVRSPLHWPVHRRGIDLGEEVEVWVHRRLKPLTGSVAVTVFSPGGEPWAGIEVFARVHGKTLNGRTDGQGIHRFEDLPDGKYDFWLDHAGVESRGGFLVRQTASVQLGRESPVVLGSPPETERVVIEVVDPLGAPQSGVNVTLQGVHTYGARTDDGGQAVFDPVVAGRYVFVIHRQPADWIFFDGVVVRAGEDNRRTVKLGGATIRGHVRAEAPAGITVVVVLEGVRGAHVATGSDGSFLVKDAAPGKYSLMFATPDLVPYMRKFEVEVPGAGDPGELEIRLEAMGTLKVRVARADGRPAPGTEVVCVAAGVGVQLLHASTGARASEFEHLLEAGSYRVGAAAPGYALVKQDVEVKGGEEKRLEFTLREEEE